FDFGERLLVVTRLRLDESIQVVGSGCCFTIAVVHGLALLGICHRTIHCSTPKKQGVSAQKATPPVFFGECWLRSVIEHPGAFRIPAHRVRRAAWIRLAMSSAASIAMTAARAFTSWRR